MTPSLPAAVTPFRRARYTMLALLVALAGCGDDDGAAVFRAESAPHAGTDAVMADVPEEAAGGGSSGFMPAPTAPPDASAPADASASPDAAAQPRMLIRTGSATVEVEELDDAVDAVRGMTERAGGFLANVALSGGRDRTRMATLTLRIPATLFDATLAGLDSLGTVESVHIGSEDVGEQYADLEVRISNARRLEQRLLDLLATRTGSLEDVLAVERELARIRESIERMDAQMRSMRDRVAMSTLTITLHEPEPLFSGGGENVIVRSVRQAGRNFVGFVGALIASLGVLLPVAILAALVWLFWRRWRRRRRA